MSPLPGLSCGDCVARKPFVPGTNLTVGCSLSSPPDSPRIEHATQCQCTGYCVLGTRPVCERAIDPPFPLSRHPGYHPDMDDLAITILLATGALSGAGLIVWPLLRWSKFRDMSKAIVVGEGFRFT